MRIIHAAGRRWRWGIAPAVAILLGVAFAGAGNAAAPQAKAFSAVQLSDAVLFNVGPAAPNLASLKRGKMPWTDAMTKSQQAIDAAIGKDPKWASSFASRLQSGDPNQIQGALGDLGTLAYAAVTKQFGEKAVVQAVNTVSCLIDKKALIVGTDLANEFASYSGDILWVDNDVVIYSELAAASVAIVFVAVVIEKQACPNALPQEQLAQELVVRAIAANLRTAGV
jgi:hypothetical protein